MSRQPAEIERTVIAAIRSASAGPASTATAETEVLQVLDSLGFFMALVDIQHTLNLSLEPQQIVGMFKCQRVADMVAAFTSIVSGASTAPVAD